MNYYKDCELEIKFEIKFEIIPCRKMSSQSVPANL